MTTIIQNTPLYPSQLLSLATSHPRPRTCRHSLLMIGSISALLFSSAAVHATDYLVKNQAEYKKIEKKLQADDLVVLANGDWPDFKLTFKGQGTKAKPIRLQAQEAGKVRLIGQSNLRLSGQYLEVKGLVFQQGYSPTGEVISFRTSSEDLAFHSRVTEVVVDEYSNPDRLESDHWVVLYGQHNRFDHSYLAGKRNVGVTLAVRLNSPSSQQNYHQIDHNYFGYRPVLGSNGGETIRIGTSQYSMSDSLTDISNNVFEHCDGEVEIISVKSGKNRIRGNLFLESRGTLTLRHGNGNIVDSNVFLGNNVPHTGGIRVINRDQVITNNYLENLTGSGFGSGFAIMNGVPNSPINRYHPVVNARIEHNSFINVAHLEFAAGKDQERSVAPTASRFAHNLIANTQPTPALKVLDDISGIQFENNLTFQLTGDPSPLQQSASKGLTLSRAANGLTYPADQQTVGVPAHLNVISKAQVGPSWFEKKSPDIAFASGKTLVVDHSAGALAQAIQQANDGDVLQLAAGEYQVESILSIDKTLTIRAAKVGTVTLFPARTSLFEIANGGSLQLVGLVLSGARAPDAAGSALIRTQKWGMYMNYRLLLDQVSVQQLNINHSFHVFDAGARSFASLIDIRHSKFQQITGDVLRLNKETDDLGVYNAEYVMLQHNQFTNIEGAVATVYRGGTDESTFGPHFYMAHNTLQQVGLGKRNRSNASVFLLGAQDIQITGNQWQQAAGVVIQNPVGVPKISLSANIFADTPAPLLSAVEMLPAVATNHSSSSAAAAL